MKVGRLVLAGGFALTLGAVAQAEEIRQPVAATPSKALELSQEQLDEVTAARSFAFLGSSIGSLKPGIQSGANLLVLFFLQEAGGN